MGNISDAPELLWNVGSFQELTAIQLYRILKVRSEVFVVEQNCPYLDTDGLDPVAIHLWAEVDGEVAAYCRIFGPGIKYSDCSIGRVVTAEKFRRMNYGKILMKLAVDVVAHRFSTSEIRISAQDYLLDFYSGFGFQDTGKKYLEDNIPHSEMFRK